METLDSSAQTMWANYLTSIGETVENTQKIYQAWSFGSSPDELADLVLKGDKRATTSLYEWYGLENEPVPKAGDLSIILGSNGKAKCIIETKKVTIVPFCEATEEFAHREGEGDRSLAYWRKVHHSVFSLELKEIGREFTEDMPVVCEEFDVVYRP